MAFRLIEAWSLDDECWPLNDDLVSIDSPRGVDDLLIQIDADGSFNTVETLLKTNKRVIRFSEPLVTMIKETPRLDADMKKELFYSGWDISNFRKQHRIRYGDDKQYDRVYCEELVEELDAMGADSFAKGDPQKALFAFQHSLRVKTETLVDFNHLSTANTIHCIADIYSKQRKWSHALGAYESALEVLSYRGTLNDKIAIQAVISLQKKIAIIRTHTQIASSRIPSTVSL